jgi:hypothetical protein
VHSGVLAWAPCIPHLKPVLGQADLPQVRAL